MPLAVMRQCDKHLDGMVCTIGELEHRHSTGSDGILAAGKAAGILSTDRAFARRCLDAGANFVAVGVDTSLLANAATELARAFKNTAPVSNDNAKDGSVY